MVIQKYWTMFGMGKIKLPLNPTKNRSLRGGENPPAGLYGVLVVIVTITKGVKGLTTTALVGHKEWSLS